MIAQTKGLLKIFFTHHQYYYDLVVVGLSGVDNSFRFMSDEETHIFIYTIVSVRG